MAVHLPACACVAFGIAREALLEGGVRAATLRVFTKVRSADRRPTRRRKRVYVGAFRERAEDLDARLDRHLAIEVDHHGMPGLHALRTQYWPHAVEQPQDGGAK